ncbi:unnamed protein product, partial [Rotaria sp. Silwood2]
MENSTLYRANIMFIPRGIRCGGTPPSLLEAIRVKTSYTAANRTIPMKPYLTLPLPIVAPRSHNLSFRQQVISPVKSGPIIIISRRMKRNRNLKNEMEIKNFLSKEYPTIPVVIFYGNLPMINTIALFRSARVLIAPHGAGQ